MGELVAYRWLEERYDADPSCWRSAYRRHVFADGIPGDDGLGYDFEIPTGRGPLLFEAKATTTDNLAFELGETELKTAQRHWCSRRYRILFISSVADSASRRLLILPNPLSRSGQDRCRVAGKGIRYQFQLDQ